MVYRHLVLLILVAQLIFTAATFAVLVHGARVGPGRAGAAPAAAPANPDELRVVDLGRADFLELVRRGDGSLEATLGPAPGELLAAPPAARPEALDLTIERAGRTGRLLVLLHGTDAAAAPRAHPAGTVPRPGPFTLAP